MIRPLSRRTTLGLLGGVALAVPARAGGSHAVDATTVAIEGRTAAAADGSLRIGYPGVALHFACDGPAALTVSASSGDCWLDISVDGALPRVVHLAAEPQSVPLCDSGQHRVMVLKRTEAWQGIVEASAITGPRRVTPLPLPARRLLFIGDSITCGAAADVPDAASTLDGTAINDGAKSYGRVLAATLNAACHLVSYGGRGIMRDWQGSRTIVNAPTFYERALPDDPAAPWDHGRFVPHAVGIMLGTNDFNQGVPDQNEFVNTYAEFVRAVMRDAPAAPVLLLDSPMTNDESATLGHLKTAQRDYLDHVVAAVGSERVRHVLLGHYPGRAVNSHPIASEHVAIAAELAPAFRTATGWA